MRLKVYYIDDEPDLLMTFMELFSSAFVDVMGFTCVDQFLKAIETSPPDLVFMDYCLHETNADEISKKLDPSIPKAVITGKFETDIVAFGYDASFPKPFTVEQIQEFITRYLKSG